MDLPLCCGNIETRGLWSGGQVGLHLLIPNPQFLLPGSASAVSLERLSQSPAHDPRPRFSHEAGRAYAVHTLAHRDELLQAQGI